MSESRLASLDQYRGYTVAGMFVVNWLGAFAFTPEILKHHRTWCSYADTIMPQFFFAAGFALRLVWLKLAAGSTRAAYSRMLRRGIGLFIFGVIFYQFGDQWKSWTELHDAGWQGFLSLRVWGQPFQALVHIAVTGLWILPVIGKSGPARVLYAAASAGIHLWISHAFWFETLIKERVIDGGPPGFLTWTLPAMAGTLAFDAVRSGMPLRRMVLWSLLMMAGGWGLSCLSNGGVLAAPPFFANTRPHDLWTMSQKAGSTSYLLFSAGFSLLAYAAFRAACDLRGLRLTLFQDLGSNALAAYVLHNLIMDFCSAFAPKDSPAWWGITIGALHFGLVWWMVRWLNGRGIHLRL